MLTWDLECVSCGWQLDWQLAEQLVPETLRSWEQRSLLAGYERAHVEFGQATIGLLPP